MLSILCNKKICNNNSSNNNNNDNKWCTRRIHDIRVAIQDGIQWRRQPANTSAGTMGQTPSETDRQDTLSKNSRPIQHCALESGLVTTRRWLAKCLTNNCMWTKTWWWGRTDCGQLVGPQYANHTYVPVEPESTPHAATACHAVDVGHFYVDFSRLLVQEDAKYNLKSPKWDTSLPLSPITVQHHILLIPETTSNTPPNGSLRILKSPIARFHFW